NLCRNFAPATVKNGDAIAAFQSQNIARMMRFRVAQNERVRITILRRNVKPMHPTSKRLRLAEKLLRSLKKIPPQGRVFFTAQFSELLQLCPLFGIEPRGYFHNHAHKQITALASVHVDDTFSAELEALSALR